MKKATIAKKSRILAAIGAISVAALLHTTLPAFAETPSSASQSSNIQTTATQIEGTQISHIAVGDGSSAVAIDATAHRAYVANEYSNSVSVIDTTSNKVVDTISVGQHPAAIAVDSQRHQVYVANTADRTISIINTVSQRVEKTVLLADGRPVALAINETTGQVYIATANLTIDVMDSNGSTDRSVNSVGDNSVGDPTALAINQKTHTLYNANAGDDPIGEVLSYNLPSQNQRQQQLLPGNLPSSLFINESSNTIYVTNMTDGTVSVINLATGRTTHTIKVGGSPTAVTQDMAAHGKIYVANEASGTVSVIDPSTWTVTQTLTVGGAPSGVAIDQTTHTLYVTNIAGDAVTAIALDTK